MPTAKERAERLNRDSAAVEASQAELRNSIEETERLVLDSDRMLRRHRRDRADGDTAGKPPEKS